MEIGKGANQISNAFGVVNNRKTSKTKEQQVDFSSLFENVKAEQSNSDYAGEKTQTVSKTSTTDDCDVKTENNMDDSVQVKESAETCKDDEKYSAVDEKATVLEEEQDCNQTVLEENMEIILDIKTVLMDQLNLSEEELDTLLEDMGVNMVMLLNTDALKELVLTVNDAEPIDFVTNEALADTLSNVTDAMKQLIQDSNISEDMLQNVNMAWENLNVPLEAAEEVKQQTIPVVEPQEDTKLNQEVDLENTMQGPNVIVDTDKQSADHAQTDLWDENQNQEDAIDYKSVSGEIVKQINQSIDQLQSFDQLKTESVHQEQIVEQIVEQIKLTVKQDTTSMELSLYPEHLGKLQIQVSDKGGVLTAQITAETELAKAAIENSLHVLKEAFNNQELKVEAVEVNIATTGFDAKGQKQDASHETKKKGISSVRRINLNDLSELEEDALLEDDKLNVEMMEAEGRSVDFSA